MSRNSQQVSEIKRSSPHQRKIPVLHIRARKQQRAREEQEKKLARQTATNEQLSSLSIESTHSTSPSIASIKSDKSNSTLNPNAQEFVFASQPFTGLKASAPEFVPMPQQAQPIVIYPMPIQRPIMVMMPTTQFVPIPTIQIPPPIQHDHHHAAVYAAEDVEEAQRMVSQSSSTPDSASSTSSTSEASPAPKLETIEEESELDWEEDTRAVFFPKKLDVGDDDCKEQEDDDDDEEDDDEEEVQATRDYESGEVLDGVVRRYRLDQLISYRSLSICQAAPADDTLLMGSILSCVSIRDRSAMEDALSLMSEQTLPLHLLGGGGGSKRIVGNSNFNKKNRNSGRPRFGVNKRTPPPRRPIKLSELSQRRQALSVVPQTELDALMKKCRSVLNKITPENSERLMNRLSELVESKVKCYEHLEVILSAIVDVGIVQTAFVERYVQILKDMATKTEDLVRSWDWIAQCDENIDSMKIVKIIVRRCCEKNHKLYWHTCNSSRQIDFLHSFVTTELDGNLRCCPRELSSLVIEYCTDEEAMSKVKRKFLGLEVLMGQLHKEKMMSTKLICQRVINPLLRVVEQGNENEPWRGSVCAEELEAVCKLMTVVGFELDAKAPKWMDTYFGVIETASSNLESRMKFMVMDLKDLRAANWGRPREQLQKANLKRRHLSNASPKFQGNFSSHVSGSHPRRRPVGRGSYPYRPQTKYVRRSS